MRVQLLSEKDREKYGAPEWIEFEYGRWGLKLVGAMENAAIEEDGSGWTVEDLNNNVFRTVLVDKLDDNGNVVVEDGRPVKEESTLPKTLACVVLAWLAVRSLPGNRVRWDDFDIQRGNLAFDWSSGKAKKAEGSEEPPG